MTRQKYYAIRHKETQQLMPALTRGRGYTHWNPSSGQTLRNKSTGCPRLFETKRKAISALTKWFHLPNAGMIAERSGEYGEELDYYVGTRNNDNRKKDDIEVIEVRIFYV